MDSIKFNDFVRDKGYTLPNSFNYSIGLGELVRFKDTNKSKPNTDLWLKNMDNNIFVFGDWKTGEKYTYVDDDNQYNSHYKRELNHKIQQYKQAELQSKQKLAQELESYYTSLPQAKDNHPYLVAKNVKSHEVIKQDKDNLIIPCFGIDEPFNGKLQSIQTISPNGFKQFYSGANAKNSFLALNKSSNDSFIFVEGLVTGMSILQAVQRFKADISIIICFNCNGLKPVVSYFNNIYPEAELNIYADNDLNGVGIKKATEIAKSIPSVYINPPPLTDKQKQSGLSDWNDYLTKVRGDILK